MHTEKEFGGVQMFWIGLTAGFSGCILLSNLLGWYS